MRATFTDRVTPVNYLTYAEMMGNPGVYGIHGSSCQVLVIRGVSKVDKINTTVAVNTHAIGNSNDHYPCSGPVYYKKSGTLNIEV